MANTYRLNTPLPPLKTGDPFPITDEGTQVGMDDINAFINQIADMRSSLRGDEINVKNYGALGDGSNEEVDGDAINAAIADAAATLDGGSFGATVLLPRGVYITNQKIILQPGVRLVGDGAPGTWLIPADGFNDTALIENLHQDGTQEYAFLENLLIDGRNGAGAVCSVAVVNLVSLFIHSHVRNCVILNGSAVGLRLAAGGTPGGAGPVYVDNVWVDGCAGDNVVGEEIAGNAGAVCGFYFNHLTSEHQGSGKSALKLKGLGKSAGWRVTNFHTEMGNAATTRRGITIDGVSFLTINGVQILCDPTTVSAGIVIENNAQNVGIEITDVYNPNLCNPVISDLKNGVTYGAVNVKRYVTADVTYDRMRVAPTGGTKSLIVADSSAVERAWFDANGRLTGASVNGAGIDVAGDAANNRTVSFVPAAGSAFSTVYAWYYPTGGGGVLRLRNVTGGVDVVQIGTDGSEFHYEKSTFQKDAVFGSMICKGSLASIPTTGAHVVGEFYWNHTPTAGGFIGWVCVTAGTPGTWKTFGLISP